MRRRDISKALFATAAGSAVVAQRAEAQSCTAPCYYALTMAESAAGVMPVVYTYPELTFERYGGSAGASAATNYSSWQSAMAVVSKKGGGTLLMQAPGALYGTPYNFGANTLTCAYGLILQGASYNTVLKFSVGGTTAGVLLPSGSPSGRVELRDLSILGPGDGITGASNAGWGLQMGDTGGNAGFVLCRKVQLNGWGTGAVFGGLIWGRFEQCEFGGAVGNALGNISNNVGIDFNFQNSSNQVNAVTFQDCVISNNANNGVKATNVAAAMNIISWLGLTVQNNCQSATGNPQFYMGPVNGFTIKGIYSEYIFTGTAPTTLNIGQAQWGSIEDFYFNGCNIGINDSFGFSVSQVSIRDGAILNNSGNPLNLEGETDLKVENVRYTSGTPNATNANGSKAYLATGYGISAWKADEVSFSPALAFDGGGSIDQTVAYAIYSIMGNTLTYSLRINWTTVSSPSGNVSITGFPVAPKTADEVGDVFPANIAFTAGQMNLYIANSTTTGLLYNAAATGTSSQVQGSGFTANGFVIVSGSYQV